MYSKDCKMFDSEDEKTIGSDSDLYNSDESGSYFPKRRRKETTEKRLFKKQFLQVLRKGTDAAAGDFVISGKLENAPIAVISVKVNTVCYS